MNLGYKQYFPFDGEPTNFDRKIIKSIHPESIYHDYPSIIPKIHTIREDQHNRWKPGMKIHHVYGVRTKNYDCFAEGVCTHIQIMEIREMYMCSSGKCYRSNNKIFRVYVDGRILSLNEIETLAKNDGFNRIDDFFKWFNEPCTRKIIHWTDFKY